jgi:hypothetical protein
MWDWIESVLKGIGDLILPEPEPELVPIPVRVRR